VIVVLAASALAAPNKSLNIQSFFACPDWSNAFLCFLQCIPIFLRNFYGDKYPKYVIKLM
jgi:hypothetical protein